MIYVILRVLRHCKAIDLYILIVSVAMPPQAEHEKITSKKIKLVAVLLTKSGFRWLFGFMASKDIDIEHGFMYS